MSVLTRDPPAKRSIEPRIRERRIQVRREAGRRRLTRLAMAGIVSAVLFVAAAVAFSPLLDVGTVEVTGMYRTPVEEVMEAGGIDEGEPLVLIDTGAAERRVEALPWVADARVTRQWSGAVRYEIRERTPLVAVATEDGGWMAADADGRLVARLDEASPDLARLEGVETSAAVGGELDAEALPALFVADAVATSSPGGAVVLGESDVVELRLITGGAVVFGAVDDPEVVEDQALALNTVLEAVGPSCVQRLDLRAPEAPVLTPSAGCR